MNIYEELLKNIKFEHENEQPCMKPYKYSNKLLKKVKKALDDIDTNRNHSWAVEMFDRNINNMDKIAIFYRGNKISYKQMFENAFKYAKSLKQLGFKKNSEIPMCITNTPEFVYLFLATSFIGAKAHVIGDWFNKDYLIDILNKTESKVLFIDDISYDLIKNSIDSSNIEKIVCFSLTNSFITDKNGNKFNPYEEIDSKFHNIKNNVDIIKSNSIKEVYDNVEFINFGNFYNDKVIENVDLNDVCSITYTSGTTTPGHPKGVMQSNRSYITLSRFKEYDVSGMPTMRNMSILSHIPTYTHMELSCAISDTLYCGCELSLEPFYDKDFFPYSLLINKPNFVPASTGFWGNLCKLLNFNENWKNINMPYLMIPCVTGEGCSQGEEKFFNLTARKHKFGVEKLPFPLSPVTFSIGGGTTESSGIFVTLYKSLQEKRLNYLIKKESLGLTPHKFAEVEVLDKNGNYCKINEPGLLVANNPCEMIGYTEESLNRYTHIIDSTNHKWLKLGTYAYKDETGRIKMKGRMGNDIYLSNGIKIPYYYIEDEILLDTKNIMSCSVVSNNDRLICHIEFQPYKQKSDEEIIKAMVNRIDCNFPDEIKDMLYFRIRNNVESFPLDPSGKRSLSTLTRIGIDDKTISFRELNRKYMENNTKTLKKKY